MCWMKDRKRREGEREWALFTQMLMPTCKHLSPPCCSARGSKHLLDSWRHSRTEVATRVSHNPRCKGAEGVCVCVTERESNCVCVRVRAWSQIPESHDTTLIQKLRGRGWRSVHGVMVRGKDGWMCAVESLPFALRPTNQLIDLSLQRKSGDIIPYCQQILWKDQWIDDS